MQGTFNNPQHLPKHLPPELDSGTEQLNRLISAAAFQQLINLQRVCLRQVLLPPSLQAAQ